MSRLLNDIEKYFDCLLSDEEEKVLMEEVALSDSSHPLVEEAKAVMGFRVRGNLRDSGIKPLSVSRNLTPGVLKLHRVAAAVAIICAGFILKFMWAVPSSECIAFVKGVSVTEEEQVMEVMRQNLCELNEGAMETEDEILDELVFLAPLSQQYEPNPNSAEI